MEQQKEIATFTAIDGTSKIRGEVAVEVVGLLHTQDRIDIVVDGNSVFTFKQRGTAGNWFLTTVRRIEDGLLLENALQDIPYMLERHN